jgi:outer membrane protein TolC
MQPSRWSFLLLLLCTGFFAQAQELSLDQLIDQALKTNQDVRIANLNESKTEARINEVKANARPQVNFSGDYKRYLKIPGQVVPASTFGGPEGSYQTLALGLPYNLSSTLQVSQALYNPSVKMGLKAAHVSQELAGLQTVQTREEVAYQVSATYYNLQTVAQQMAFLRSNLRSTERMIQITDLLYKNQLSQGIDVDRLRIQQTQARTQLESQGAAYQQLLNMLKYLTGTPQTDSLRVRINPEANAATPVLSDQPANRTDLLLLDRRKSLNELSQRNTKVGFIPTLSLYGVANSTFFGQDGANAVLRNVPGYWVGLQLNWSIYDGSARKALLSQQRIENQTLALQTEQTRESISMEVTNARNQFLVEQRNLAASREQVALAEKVYTQSQLQFKEGTASLTEVIQAKNALQEAQNNYLNTLVSLRSAELAWKKATGTLIVK